MPAIGDLLKLTRADLKTFSNETINLIMQMQEEGWKGYKNNQGHVKMLAPDGETYAVATSNINAHKYLRADYDQFNRRNGKPVVEEKPQERQKWKCARPNCPKVYLTEEQLNYHINVEHEGKIPCPECERMFDRAASMGAHRSRVHGYSSPQKKRRQELAAAKKEEAVIDEISTVLKAGKEGVKAGGETMIRKIEDAIVASGSAEIPSREQISHEIIRVVEKGDEFITEEAAQILGVKPRRPDDPTFDPHFVSAYLRAPIQEDVMSEEMIQRSENSLKEAFKNVYPTQLLDADQFVIPPFSDRTAEYFDHFTADEAVQGPAETKKVSWTVDTSTVSNERIKDLKRFMKAAGLEMEIRVWRKDGTA